MKISKISKIDGIKYKLIIDDDEYILYDNVLLKNNILLKKDITLEELNNIKKDNEYYEVYYKTLKFVSKKIRCEYEVKRYLEKENINDKIILKVIEKLKGERAINDEVFCNAYISDKINFSKLGINKIKLNLLQFNIDENIIDNAFKLIDSEVLYNKLEKLIIKKINSNRKYSNYILKQKILNEMIMLGYDKNIVLEILENNLKTELQIMESEFKKLKIKYSKKYSGEELNKKLKEKLLSKGFSYDEISNLF